jgi:hypothetical protein
MVRPSSLSLAEHCELAPILAEEFPETNAAIERGNLVDREVARELLGGAAATDPDALACLEWLSREGIVGAPPVSEGATTLGSETTGGHLFVQESISLAHPQTGEEITRGTPDIVWIKGGEVTVIDLKKREQQWAGRLPDVDRSLQLHAYGLAWAIRSGARSYKLAYLLFGDGDASGMWSGTYSASTWQSYLDRMMRIVDKSNATVARGTKPRPTAGPHCAQCYQRIHCPSWLLPAHQGETALSPLSQPGGLTAENAGVALMAVMAIEEAAERAREILKAYATVNGPIVVGDRQWAPVLVQGRQSGPPVKELEAMGLSHLIRNGKPFLQWRMGKRQ